LARASRSTERSGSVAGFGVSAWPVATARVSSVGTEASLTQLILPVLGPAPQAKGAPQPASTVAWEAASDASTAIAA
jgi:hypothetical protein